MRCRTCVGNGDQTDRQRRCRRLTLNPASARTIPKSIAPLSPLLPGVEQTGSVAAVGCGHVMAGSFGVTGASVGMKSTDPEAYVAAALSAGARARVFGPLHVEGAVDAQVPFTRPTFLTTTCPPTGFEPPFVALALWLGAGISIR